MTTPCSSGGAFAPPELHGVASESILTVPFGLLTDRQHRSRYQETGAVCLFFRFGAGGLPFQPNGKAAVPRLQDHRGECCLKAALRDSDRIGEPFMAEIQSVPADGNRIVSAPEFQRQFRRVLRGEALLTEGQSPGGSVGRGNRYGQRAGSFVLCKRDAVDRSGKAPRTVLLRRDAAAAVQYRQVVVNRAPCRAGRFQIPLAVAVVENEQIAEEENAVPQEQIAAPVAAAELD